MAVKIRLTRIGSKKNPIYRVVVAEPALPRDGRSIETIGRYNPQLNPSLVEIDAEKAREWLEKGAQPTEPVKKLLKMPARRVNELLLYLARQLVAACRTPTRSRSPRSRRPRAWCSSCAWPTATSAG